MPPPPPVELPWASAPRPADCLVSALAGPDPAPVLALGHCFYTPTLGRVRSLVHRPANISGEATLTPEALVLHFQAPPDDLRFELHRPQLSVCPAWVAAYPLRSQSQPLAPTDVWYYYTREEAAPLRVSRLKLSSRLGQLRGCVAITAYDAQRQLLSGYFEVRANDQRDPTTSAVEAACTIILAGDFDGVKLTRA